MEPELRRRQIVHKSDRPLTMAIVGRQCLQDLPAIYTPWTTPAVDVSRIPVAAVSLIGSCAGVPL